MGKSNPLWVRKRMISVMFRVSAEERYRWQFAAEAQGLTMQAFVIKAVNQHCDALEAERKRLEAGLIAEQIAATNPPPTSAVNPLVQQAIDRQSAMMRGQAFRRNGHPQTCGCGICLTGG